METCKHNQLLDYCQFCRNEAAQDRLDKLRKDHNDNRKEESLAEVLRYLRELDVRMGTIDEKLKGMNTLLVTVMGKI